MFLFILTSQPILVHCQSTSHHKIQSFSFQFVYLLRCSHNCNAEPGSGDIAIHIRRLAEIPRMLSFINNPNGSLTTHSNGTLVILHTRTAT